MGSGLLQARRRASPETKPAGTLTWTSSLQHCEKRTVLQPSGRWHFVMATGVDWTRTDTRLRLNPLTAVMAAANARIF